MIDRIQELLTKDEKPLYDARMHWMVFGSTITYAFIGLAVALFFMPIIGAIIWFMTLYPLYNSVVNYITMHLVLTNKKVLARYGFLSRDWIQLSLERIETAYLEEPIIGRIFGYSTIVIKGTGTGAIAIPYVTQGDIFIRKLENMLGAYYQDPEDLEEVEAEVLAVA
tara:strand:+ start:744 stop:1244 length:501 start_codon:yes stop_codon:yes gene_type:complete